MKDDSFSGCLLGSPTVSWLLERAANSRVRRWSKIGSPISATSSHLGDDGDDEDERLLSQSELASWTRGQSMLRLSG